MMKLLEVKFEKRMSAKDSLEHEYLVPLKKKGLEDSPVNFKK